MLSLALGITSGVAFSAGGWIATGLLLMATAVAACISAGLGPLAAFGAIAAAAFAYNSGLCLGLIPAIAMSARRSAP